MPSEYSPTLLPGSTLASLLPTSRDRDLTLGAGWLLDIGVYSLTWVTMALAGTGPTEMPSIMTTQTHEEGDRSYYPRHLEVSINGPSRHLNLHHQDPCSSRGSLCRGAWRAWLRRDRGQSPVCTGILHTGWAK